MTELACPLMSAAQRYGDLPALIDRNVTLTWSQTLHIVDALADRLKQAGVRKGDRVAVVENNRIELPLLIFANIRIGAVTVLLSPRYPRSTLLNMNAAAGCGRAAVWRDSRTRIPLPGVVDLSLPTAAELFAEAGGRATDSTIDPTVSYDSNQPTTIVFTSGSSGPPKAALHSFGNHYYSALGSNQNLPVQPGDRWLLSLPLYHVGGLGVLFRCLIAGGGVVFPDSGSPLNAQITRDMITHLSLVPTQLQRLVAQGGLHTALSSLKGILLGGGPTPASLMKKALEAGLPVRSSYGLTEMTSQVATGTSARPDLLRPLLYRAIRIGDYGEICVRGETLFLGYVENGSVQLSRDREGWFHTGDIGIIDPAGFLTVIGRCDNMFVSGGENIHPEQIEAAVCAIDGIDDALAVAIDDPEYGRRPVVFVKYRPDINLSEADSDLPEEARFRFDHQSLSAELAKTLPHYMLPVAYHPWPQGYDQIGIKGDRVFFAQLAAKLHRPRT